MPEEVAQLRTQRGVIKSKVTRLQTHFNKIKNDTLNDNIITELGLRLEKIESALDEFNDLQATIENLAPSETDETEREQFENLFFSVNGNIKTLCNNYELNKINNSSGSIHSGTNRSDSSNSFIKLPTIKLPTFDGEYGNWLEFRDAFRALVDSNDSLSEIQKFYYLRSSLEKEASETIKSIEVSAANYKNAWQILIDRYENKKLMIHNHIKAIIEYPSINKESHVELRKLFDTITKHLRSLSTLGEKTDSWDRLIIYILTNKFDSVTRRDWESFKYEAELPSMSDLNTFLKNKCEILEKLEINKSEKHKSQPVHINKKQPINSFVASTSKYKCYFCNQDHAIYKCDAFLKLSVNERIAKIKALKLCLNCMRSSHSSWNCSARKCFKCNKRHNSLLHSDSYNNSSESVQTPKITVSGNSTEAGTSTAQDAPTTPAQNMSISSHILEGCAAIQPVASQVLLSTALVKIRINDTDFITCRALLDSGSQSHFITEKLTRRLKLHPSKVNHVVKGVGQTLANISNQVNLTIGSCYNNFNINISCLVIHKITDKLPTIPFDQSLLKIPSKLNLADPNFNVPSEIDMLLGSNVFWTIICSNQQQLGENLPILQNTKLGWVIAGNLCVNQNYNSSINCLNINLENSIDDKIVKFWQLEEPNVDLVLSETDKYCEAYFEKTLKRDVEGRFIVSIPFKESLKNLGSSREVAITRFHSLERKLARDPNLKLEYVKFMTEYQTLNHMSEISEVELQSDGYYLPHHAVLKTMSLTTKCRVVFDASAKTDSGLSLNDVQFSGPALQQDIFSILIRFRKHKYVISADVSKMYRQILVNENERKYQKIFWRTDPSEKLKCYQLNTVTYGTASAPYLAIRCLRQVAIDNKLKAPVASKIISNDFFVDDLLTGADTVADVLNLQTQITGALLDAGFELRKWLCNDPTILNNIQVNNDLEASILKIGENEQNKTLGIYWNPNCDFIQYSVCDLVQTTQVTKRIILSIICQIYDPLGLLGPIIITAKLIMQELWKLKISWDTIIPQNLYLSWSLFRDELPVINDLKIDRHVVMSEYSNIELHGFCDSSEKAYGACLYIRCTNVSGTHCSKLLCAKSRVAPLKQVSLPRLELCGALLLATLAKKAIQSLGINFNATYFWTDSLITLAWIRGDPTRWKTFVANRVSEIQSLTNINDWQHVKSDENSADLLSRGVSPNNLSDSALWWHGPEWLLKDSECWKLTQYSGSNLDIPEQRTISCAITSQVNPFDFIINKISCIYKIERILAYVLRFMKNLRLPREQRRLTTYFVASELDNALALLIQTTQQEAFFQEYKNLQNNQQLSNKSNILSLNPFLKDNLIRVGGRLKNSSQPYDKKHPVILPKGHKVTDLILQAEHEKLLHCGVQTLLCSIRDRYWPISGRNSCKNIVKKCITCFKANPTNTDYIMGDLPEVRVNDYAPFKNVGVDFGGPFLLKDRTTRGAKLVKAYICLFVCMSTKAVHLELVSELSTRAFMATLNRFISRRGKPSDIYSDNGSNFVGANNELTEIYSFLKDESNSIARQLVDDRVNWHFIPARSPSFGGIWEAGIKNAKFHIKRVIGSKSLTFEEFGTVLTRIEGILNSRPLCPLSSDPEDLSALTPAHFLIGRSLIALPEHNLIEVPENRLCRFQRVQATIQHYWSRWQKEYLSELQVRTKWKQRSQQLLKPGLLVLLKEDNAPVLNWRLGRIVTMYPGNDGVTRVIDVKVRGGIVRRAVNRVCVLPIE